MLHCIAAIPCQFARADVVFLVDSSRSICGSDSTCSSWRSLLSFVNSIVDQLNIGSDNTRIGFVRYSSASATNNEFYLGDNLIQSQVTTAVSGIQYSTGRAFVGDLANALQVARTEQFLSTRGDRIGAANIIIVLMNGGITVTSSAVSPSPVVYLRRFTLSRVYTTFM